MVLFRLLFVHVLTLSAVASSDEDVVPTYGIDVSWPMHRATVTNNYPWLPHNVDPSLPVSDEYKDMPLQPLGDVQSRYERYIQGCVDYYEAQKEGLGQICLSVEKDRLDMTLRQPQSMRNYTKMGYTKIRAPDHVFQLLKNFWEKNKGYQKIEELFEGNVYLNNWESPTYMVSLEDPSLEGSGPVLKQHVWNAARDTLEQWTGQKQVECSLFGIRVYKNGAMLAPHVDRNPLVASAIINIDQDVDEPWPLEVIGHDGIARNVTMVPGDLVLYESHSVIHGRQFPLKGRFMANVFIHFEPIGPIGGPVEYNGAFPPYIIPGSPEDENWRAEHKEGHILMGYEPPPGSSNAHLYASQGDIKSLTNFIDHYPDSIRQRDDNGWTPLVEAVRSGEIETVRLLLDRGSEANLRLGTNEQGGSVLWLAKHEHGDDHPVVKLLKERGATDETPPNLLPEDEDEHNRSEEEEEDDDAVADDDDGNEEFEEEL